MTRTRRRRRRKKKCVGRKDEGDSVRSNCPCPGWAVAFCWRERSHHELRKDEFNIVLFDKVETR